MGIGGTHAFELGFRVGGTGCVAVRIDRRLDRNQPAPPRRRSAKRERIGYLRRGITHSFSRLNEFSFDKMDRIDSNSSMAEARVSVLGLGIIGSIWSGHYASAGVLAGTWNRTPKPDSPAWCETAELAAEAGSIIQLCLYDPDSVDEVLEQIHPVLAPGKIVVQSSTIDPIRAEEFAHRVRSTGARYVEAPFTGSKPAAEQRQTVFFLGGEASDLESIEPTLALISRKQFQFETPTQAATIKLAMNHQISAITQSLCKGVTWARIAGLEDSQFFDVLRENVAWSGLAGLKENKIREMDFSPQFSIRNMEKDMRLASESAPVPLPSLALVRSQLTEALESGYGDEDFVSLLRLLS